MSTHWAATVLRNFGLKPHLVVSQTTRPDTESGQSITKSFCCNKRKVSFGKKFALKCIKPLVFFITFNIRVPVLFVARHNYVFKFGYKTIFIANSLALPYNPKAVRI